MQRPIIVERQFQVVDIIQPNLPLAGGSERVPSIFVGPTPELSRAVDEATPHQRALTRVPTACRWIGNSSRGALGVINAAISGSPTNKARARPYLQRHFKLSGDDFTAPSAVLIDLGRYFGWMLYVLGTAVTVHNRGDRDQVFIHDEAGAEEGEPAFIPLRRDGAIHFARLYLDLGPKNQALILIHEASHFVSERVQDYVYRRLTPGRYDTLARSEAIRNAASFAYFAYHAGTGSDSVIPRAE